MKKRVWKRLLVFILAIAMVAGMFQGTGLSVEANAVDGGGSGTSSDPYILLMKDGVCTKSELLSFLKNPGGLSDGFGYRIVFNEKELSGSNDSAGLVSGTKYTAKDQSYKIITWSDNKTISFLPKTYYDITIEITSSDNTLESTDGFTITHNSTECASGYVIETFLEETGSFTITVPDKDGAATSVSMDGADISVNGNVYTIDPSKSETLTIDYIALSPADVTATSNLYGKVTLAGTRGEDIVNGEAGNSSSCTSTFDIGSTVTLTAVPNADCEFFRWLKTDKNGTVSALSDTSKVLTVAAGDGATYSAQFYNTKTDKYVAKKKDTIYYYLQSELVDAINNAVSGETIILIDNATLNSDVTIKSGVNLLIPYTENKTDINGSSADHRYANNALGHGTYDQGGASTTIPEPNEYLYLTLTIPETTTITAKGVITVGGIIGASGGGGCAGHTSGSHSNIQLDGEIILDGGRLSTCGYILGSGKITAKNNAEIYQPYVLGDYSGGSYTAISFKTRDRTPFTYYTIMNIQTDMTFSTGAGMYVYCDLMAQDLHNLTTGKMLGTSDALLNYGTSVDISFDASKAIPFNSDYTTNGFPKATIEITGGGSVGSLSLQVSLTALGISIPVTVATSDVVFPVPSTYDFVLKSGEFLISSDIKMLPGSTITIAEGATLTVPSGKIFALYDGGGIKPYSTGIYPTGIALNEKGMSERARLILNGKLSVGGTLAGWIETNSETGIIDMSEAENNTVTVADGLLITDTYLSRVTVTYTNETSRTLYAYALPMVENDDAIEATLLMPGYTYFGSVASHKLSSYTYNVYADDGTYTATTVNYIDETVYGRWDTDYTVTLRDTTEGTPIIAVNESYKPTDANIISASITLQDGYTASCNTKADGTGTNYTITISGTLATITPADGNAMPRGDMTLYIVWTPTPYNITYGDLDGGVLAEDAKITTYSIEETVMLPIPTKTGYTFDGWQIAGSTEAPMKSILAGAKTGDLTLNATWVQNTYTVKFDANGGTGTIADVSMIYDDDAKELPTTKNVLTKTGYEFEAWNTKADGTGIAYEDRGSVSNLTSEANGVVTLYAQWTPIPGTVTLNPNGGTWSDGEDAKSISVLFGKTYSELESVDTLTKDGYEFAGWYLEGNVAGTVITKDSIVSTAGDHTLTATWEAETYDITLDAQGGSWIIDGVETTSNAIQADYKGKYSELESVVTPTRAGYEFAGWYLEGNLDGTEITSESTVQQTSNHTLVAKWTPVTYTITYRVGTENIAYPGYNEYNILSEFALPTPATIPEGYTFGGWSVGDASERITSIEPGRMGDLALVAVWLPINYSVAFNGNGATSGEMANLSVTYADNFALTNNGYAKTGYTFAGWATAEDGEVVYTDGQWVQKLSTVEGDVVELYAKWEPVQYEIVYNGNGSTDTAMENSSHVYDVEKELVANTYTRDGYTFAGWNTKADGTGTDYTDSQKVSNLVTSDDVDSITLYAIWTLVEYTISYNLADGMLEDGVTNPECFTIETPAFTLNVPSKTGYTFEGWTGSNSNTPQIFVEIARGSYGDRVYTANWTANTYQVTLDANAGAFDDASTSKTMDVVYAGTYENMATYAPIRAGYTFAGWNTQADGQGATVTVDTKVDVTDHTQVLYAQWTINSYKLSFETNGGSAIANVVADYGIEVALNQVGETTKPGYTFAGWYEDAGLTKAVVWPMTMPADGKTLYAKWTANDYVITYVANGTEEHPTTGTTNNTTHTYDAEGTLAANGFERIGYTFVGWNTKADGTGTTYGAGATVQNLAASGTYSLYATWKRNTFDVTFYKNDGTSTAYGTAQTFVYADGDTLNTANDMNFTREGYTFAGWALTENGEKVFDDGHANTKEAPVSTESGAVALYAVWMPITYAITYDLADGALPSNTSNPATYTIEAETIDLVNPTKQGYIFDGWTGTGLDSATTSVSIETGSTGNRSYVANWSLDNYTISYDLAGGQFANDSYAKTYNVEQTATLPTPIRTGYAFDGWQVVDSAEGLITNIEAGSRTGDVSLVATWIANTYTVKYDGNGATSGVMADVLHIYDEAKNLSENKFARTGYSFARWSTKSDGTGNVYTDGISVTNLATDGSITLYAQWKANTYQVTLDANHGAFEDAATFKTMDVVYADTYENLTAYAPTRAGYTFAGWNTQADGLGTTVTVDTRVDVTDHRQILYAQWTVNSYKLSFVTNGGSVVANVAADYGTEVTINQVGETTKMGYTFAGWYEDTDLTNAVVWPMTMPVDGKTLYAKWIANAYNVVYDKNVDDPTSVTGTTAASEHKYDTESALTANDYVRAGYEFAGWAETPKGDVVYDDKAIVTNLTAQANGTVTLYAVWTPIIYTVVYDKNVVDLASVTGTTVASGHEYDAASALTANSYVREGYKFSGWATTPTGAVAYDDKATVTNLTAQANGSVTLYAVWTPITYTIIYNGNGNTDGETIDTGRTYDVAAALVANGFTKTGYIFAGWATTPTGEVVYADKEVVENLTAIGNATVNLYAKWTANTYTVTFDGNGGTLIAGANMNPQAFTYDKQNALTVNAFEKVGYTFTGWSLEPEAATATYTNGQTVGNLTAEANGAVTLYAVWAAGVDTQYVVKHWQQNIADNEYTLVDTQTLKGVTEGKTVAAANTYAGFTAKTFAQETIAADGSTVVDIYYDRETYTVTWKLSQNAIDSETGTLRYGASILVPENDAYRNPSKTGYEFAGWKYQDATGNFYNEGDTISTADIVLVAQWNVKQYTITYNLPEGATISGNPASYNVETNTFTLVNPVKAGYTFLGWTGSNGNTPSTSVTIEKGSTENRTYTAHFLANKYKVAFHANGGTYSDGTDAVMETQEFVYDEAQALSQNAYVKAGYTFRGWAETSTGAAVYKDKEEVSKLTVTDGAVVDLYAVWAANSYIVSYDANTGSGTVADSSHTYDSTEDAVQSAETLSKTGYTFEKWNTKSDGTGISYEAGTSVDVSTGENVTLYAIWAPNEYTVVFNANGGTLPEGTTTDMAAMNFTYDTAQQLSANIYVKEGYHFLGWTTVDPAAPMLLDGEGEGAPAIIGDAASVNNLTAENGATVTLYAVWELNTYTLKFDANTGSGNMDNMAFENGIAKALTANVFTKTGYKFAGWATSANGTVVYEDKEDVVLENLNHEATVILYAVWEKADYQINWYMDGTLVHTHAVTFEDVIIPLTGLTKVGYTFDGWYPDTDCDAEDKIENFGTMPASNISYYGKWIANSDTDYKVHHYQQKLNSNDYILVETETLEGTTDTEVTPDVKAYVGFTAPSTQTVSIKADGTLEVKYYYTRNTYTVNWVIGNGLPSTTTSRLYEQGILAITSPVKDGYAFTGWYTDASCAGAYKVTSFGTMPAADVTYYGGWEAISYGITYNIDGGSLKEGDINPARYTIEDTFTLNNPVKTGYTFIGWTGSNGTTPSLTVTVPVGTMEDLSYTANYKKNTYEVKFDGNTATSGEMSKQAFTYDTDAVALSENQYVKAGYTFAGWNTKADGTGKAYGANEKVQNLSSVQGDVVTLYAQWTANTDTDYTVEYYYMGTDGQYPATVTSTETREGTTDTIATWTNVAQTGFTFDADNTKNILSGTISATDELVLKVYYERNQYTFTTDVDGETTAIKYYYEAALSTPENPTKTGYTFDGWTPTVPGTMPAADVTVEAQWEINQYTISFHTNGGTTIADKTQDYDSAVIAPADPEKVGYTFAGWYLDEACEGTAVSIVTTMPAEDLAYYAKWTPNDDTEYVVKHFKQNIASASYAEPEVKYFRGTTDAEVTPAVMNYPGFTAPATQTVTIKADGALEVKYYYVRNTYTLTWERNNGTENIVQSYVFEQPINQIIAPTKIGYNFGGWYADEACTEENKITNFGSMPAESIVYYAKWTPVVYGISYVLDGGSWIDDEGITSYTIETPDYTLPLLRKTGYTFHGWTGSNGDTANTTVVLAKGSMGAKSYSANFQANQYTVVFDGNGATSGTMPEQTFTYDSVYTALINNAYERIGHTFAGWNTEADGSGRTYANGAEVRNLATEQGAAITLYAQWTVNKYTINYDANGGKVTVVASTMNYGNSITPPADPTRDGYTFAGWEPQIPETMPVDGITVVAQWTPVTYTVSFAANADGCTGEMANMAFTYDVAQNLTASRFAREGYRFNGWNTAADGSGTTYADMEAVKNLTTTADETVTLYAKWQILPFTMTFVQNNGLADIVRTQNYNETVVMPATPYYEGYRFDYWYEDDANVEAEIPAVMPAENRTFTAHWTAYLELLHAIPIENFDNPVDDAADEEVLAKAREYYRLMNAEQKEIYKTDADYAEHYAAFEDAVRAVSVVKARKAVAEAEEGTNATLVSGGYDGNIAKLFVNDENLHVDAIIYHPEFPAADMLAINFLVELFGYEEVTGIIINNSTVCQGSTFDQFNIMLAIAFETLGRELGYTDMGEYADYLRNNMDITISELDGHSIVATVLAQTPEGIEYSVDYTLDFFNEYHDVIWVQNNGVEDTRVSTAYQSEIALPTKPTKTGYSFNHWNTKADGTGVTFADGTLMGKTEVSYYAQWNINQYTISFDAKGGSEVASITADYGAGFNLPKAPTKTGYTFAGWFDNEACTGTAVELPETMLAEDVTYYAGWTVNKYTISFNGNGGTVALASTTADYGSSIEEPATDPTRTGYTFTGWYTDSDCTMAVSWPVTMPVNGATYYAGWEANTYNVTLDAAGGTLAGGNTVTVTYGEQYGLPAPSRAGYTFLGWYLEDGTQIRATDIVDITEDIALTAQWEVGESYDITYDLGEGAWAAGTDVPDRYNVATDTFALPEPVLTGYTFLGWTGSNGDTIQKEVTVEKGTTGALSYKAHWSINQYTLTFEENGGSMVADIQADYQADVTAPADPTKTGYSFTGWYTNAECTGEPVAIPTTMPAENVTYYAGWEVNEYTIDFEENGGTIVRSITANYNAAITAPADPEKTGHTFTGWYANEACTGEPVTIPTAMPAVDVTYYAGWEVNEYSITFDSNGGSDVETLYFDYGESVVGPADPVREGHTFAGWNADLPATMPAENLTFTAKWTVNTYNIVYMVDGVAYKTQTIAYGANITPEAEPTKVGYTFSGWSAIPEKMPANTVTITGEFTANTYTVSYDAAYDMAPVINSNEVTYNSPYGTLPTVERTGYTFTNWFLNGVKVTEETVVKTADHHTLVAGWTANTYRVNLDANRGTCDVAFIDVTYDGTYAALPTPVLEGYDFVGWFDGDAQVLANQTVQITQTQNLVARWNASGDTPYKVEHYQKGLDGEYDLVLTEELTAATEAKVDATQQSFEGFYFNTQNSIASGEVLADGSLVLKMYYDRESYTVVWDLYGEEITENYLYNQPLVEPDTAKADDIYASYTFTGWNVTLPETVVANATYSAMYDLSYEATIGETTYRTLQIALERAKAGEMVVLEKDLTLTEDIVIPADVNLLIPCMDDDWGYTMVKAGDEMIGFNHDGTNTAGTTGVGPDAYTYRTLTVPGNVTITVNGTLLVNSVSGRPAGGTHEMDVTGGYGQIDLDGQIVVNQGGSLDCFGYIKGDGTVTAHSGGSVGDLYIVRNWRGGSQALGMYQSTYEYDGEKKQTYPMNEYDCHNIEADIIIEYGATYDGNVKMNADDGNGNKYYYTKFPQIDVDNGLIRLTDENAYVVRSYDPTTEVETYTIYGGANFAESSLKIITADLSTSTFIYPIDGDIKFVLKDGDYHFVNDWKFLPGEGMTVCSGAALTVDYKVHVAFYDEFYDVDNTGDTEYPIRKPAILTIEEGASFKNAGMFGGSIVTESPDILIGSQPTWGMTTLEANGYCNSSKKTIEIVHDLSITREGYTWRYGNPALGELDKSIIWNGADYDDLLAALETVPEDLDIYSDKTADPLEEVLSEVTYGLGVDKQDVIDGWTADIIKYVAELELREVMVMFDPAGGTCDVTSILVTYGDTYGDASGGTLPVPEYYGFKFLGWYDMDNVQITDTVIMKQIVDEITVTAKWEKIPADYTAVNAAIAAIPQDMTGYTAESVQAVYDAEDAVDMTLGLAEQAKVDAMAQAILDAIDNLTYVQITVSFDANGGDAVTTTFTLSYNDLYPYSELPVPTRAGYDFIGWYTAKEGGTEIKADTKVTSVTDVTLYAKWQDNTSDEPADYSNVEAAIAKVPADTAPYTVASVNKLNAAVDAVVYGLTIDRQSDVDAWAAAIEKAIAELEYKTITVYFDPVDGICDTGSIKVTYGTAVDQLPTASREYHKFLGWYTAKVDGRKVTAEELSAMTENLTLYAQYELLPADYSNIEMVKSKVPADLTCYSDASVKKLNDALDAIESGYTAERQSIVDGWANALQKALDGLEYRTMTMKYDAQGGAVDPLSIVVTYKDVINGLPTPEWDNHVFNGWFTKPVGGEQVTVGWEVLEVKDFSIYAQWTQINADYTKVYEAIDRIPENVELYYTAETVKKLQDALDAVEYGLDAGSQSRVNMWASEINIAIQKLEYVTVKVFFDYTGGTGPKKYIYATCMSPYSNLPTATRTGYTFAGWYTEAVGGEAVTNETVMTAYQEHTLYARWSGGHACPTEHFKDIDQETAWYHLNVDYVVENGIMNGTSATEFSPEETTTRGMIVTMLYRMSGETVTAEDRAASPFVDVDPNFYYADAIAWAYSTGVVNGTSATTFDPDAEITREQMVTMLYRYAAYLGDDVSARGELSAFTDAADVSPYAVEALQWGYAEGLLKGDFDATGKVVINPQGEIPRCQAAAFIHRYCEQ